MSATHQRRNSTEDGARQESTGSTESYSHSSRGFAHWLEVAPPACDLRDVIEAYHAYDSPHDAWRDR